MESSSVQRGRAFHRLCEERLIGTNTSRSEPCRRCLLAPLHRPLRPPAPSSSAHWSAVNRNGSLAADSAHTHLCQLLSPVLCSEPDKTPDLSSRLNGCLVNACVPTAERAVGGRKRFHVGGFLFPAVRICRLVSALMSRPFGRRNLSDKELLTALKHLYDM